MSEEAKKDQARETELSEGQESELAPEQLEEAAGGGAHIAEVKFGSFDAAGKDEEQKKWTPSAFEVEIAGLPDSSNEDSDDLKG